MKSYLNVDNEKIWSERAHLVIEGINIPGYASGKHLYGYDRFPDPHYTNPKIALDIISDPDLYRNKKIVDLGTGTGLIPLLLTKNNFNVVGIENRERGYDGAVYTMNLNQIFYEMILGDEKYLDTIDYDVLIMNDIFYDDFLRENHIKLGIQERANGKIVLSSLEF
jgi:2-polyprenyl-3-methyl-5-hydroxy-6-metoxy-1,4-benzoquinol methylase